MTQFAPPAGILPHRPPFLFLDEVVSCDSQRIVARRRFSPDEDFFRGHFPGHPIVPGVLLLEGMAQSFAYMALLHAPTAQGLFLTGVERARFRKPVVPNDVVEFRVAFVSERMGVVTCKGEAWVGETRVADAHLSGVVGRAEEQGPA